MRARPNLSERVRWWTSLIASFAACASVAHAAGPAPLSPPATTALPTGPLGDSVRYGQSLITNTRALAGGFVGNGLNCTNCHLDGGRAAYAAPLAGLWGVFPEFRARRGSVESLEERINDCFLRSMIVRALPQLITEIYVLLAPIASQQHAAPTG